MGLLEQQVRALPGDRRLLDHRGRVVTAEALLALIAPRRKWALETRMGRIALACPDALDNIAWLIALDGVAESVFLVPESIRTGPEFAQLCERAGCEAVLDGAEPRGASLDSSPGASTAPREPSATSWLLATSGTTGLPKLCAHTTAGLMRTVKVDRQRAASFHWALVYDPFRFAGLQVVLQALAAGSALLLCHDQPFPDQINTLRDSSVNALSATPTFWRKVVMHGGLSSHPFRQITLGGEPADQMILDALKLAYPTARIAHIYASTEAGVGFSVTDGLEGFPLEFVRSGVAGTRLRISEHGTLEIKGNGASVSAAVPMSPDGYVDSGDLVEIRGSRVLFRGRQSGTINVGGNKVVPEEVESVIRRVPGVAEVRVKGKASAMTGQLVVAEVLPLQGSVDVKSLKEKILVECRARLERHKVPALIAVVSRMEVGTTGKLLRT